VYIETTFIINEGGPRRRVKIWGGIGRELAPSAERNNFANGTRGQSSMELSNNLNHQAGGAAADVRCKQLFISGPPRTSELILNLSGEV
jgi:hypothetical protein